MTTWRWEQPRVRRSLLSVAQEKGWANGGAGSVSRAQLTQRGAQCRGGSRSAAGRSKGGRKPLFTRGLPLLDPVPGEPEGAAGVETRRSRKGSRAAPHLPQVSPRSLRNAGQLACPRLPISSCPAYAGGGAAGGRGFCGFGGKAVVSPSTECRAALVACRRPSAGRTPGSSQRAGGTALAAVSASRSTLRQHHAPSSRGSSPRGEPVFPPSRGRAGGWGG